MRRFLAVLVALAAAPAFGAPMPTVLTATIKPAAVPPGKAVKITYRWLAAPVDGDYSVFVHFLNPRGDMVFQADHDPPTPTSRWSGPLSYTRTVDVPPTVPDGVYTVAVGLWGPASASSKQRRPLIAGKGVKADADLRYRVGTLKVSRAAPPPPLDSDRRPTLNLKGYKLTFHDEFDDLSVSAWGPGTRWIAHTPYGGDFGDAPFADPQDGFPFRVQNGLLYIEARKGPNGWRSGLLSSVDAKGNGFSQTYGYFEMRAKFPKGPGTWPAFWMDTVANLRDRTKMTLEVDVVEQYGHAPQSLFTTWHKWYPGGRHEGVGDHFTVADMTEGFHTYGFMWDERYMRWYFDGVELWRQPTPPEGHQPMYIMLDLALGGGWPIDKTPNPSVMVVDYVRVYARAR